MTHNHSSNHNVVVSENSQRKLISDWLQPLDQTRFLIDNCNLQGPTDVSDDLTNKKGIWQDNKYLLARVLGAGMYYCFNVPFSIFLF